MSDQRSEVMLDRARQVLRYFLHHPHAADSLEGVVRWRLPQETIHRSVEEIDRALAWLVAEGFLLKESPTGAPAIFRLNHQQADEAERLLAERPDAPFRTRES